MFNMVPVSLIIYFALFFGFANTHQRHISSYRGRSKGFLAFMNIFFLLSCVFGFGFLFFYGFKVVWYAPIILLVIGSIAGAISFAVLDAIIGELSVSMLAFLGVPVTGYLMVISIPVLKLI